MKVLGVVSLTGAVVALADVAPHPDPVTMMYSLAVAVIGLAAMVFKNRRSIGHSAPEKVSNSDLMSYLEDFAFGPRGMSGRLDKLDEKIDTLTGKVDQAGLKIENHSVRLEHVERQCAEERLKHHTPHNAAGFGG